jgi:hypothetical protein
MSELGGIIHMDGGRSTAAVGDNPDHLLKTMGGKWRSGTGTAADVGASPLTSECPSRFASARCRDKPSESCVSKPQDNLAPR